MYLVSCALLGLGKCKKMSDLILAPLLIRHKGVSLPRRQTKMANKSGSYADGKRWVSCSSSVTFVFLDFWGRLIVEQLCALNLLFYFWGVMYCKLRANNKAQCTKRVEIQIPKPSNILKCFIHRFHVSHLAFPPSPCSTFTSLPLSAGILTPFFPLLYAQTRQRSQLGCSTRRRRRRGEGGGETIPRPQRGVERGGVVMDVQLGETQERQVCRWKAVRERIWKLRLYF